MSQDRYYQILTNSNSYSPFCKYSLLMIKPLNVDSLTLPTYDLLMVRSGGCIFLLHQLKRRHLFKNSLWMNGLPKMNSESKRSKHAYLVNDMYNMEQNLILKPEFNNCVIWMIFDVESVDCIFVNGDISFSKGCCATKLMYMSCFVICRESEFSNSVKVCENATWRSVFPVLKQNVSF